jgi:2,5-dihydroxypyridine 5,6-dioxygenase
VYSDTDNERGHGLLSNRIECKWIDCFERVFALCKIARGDAVAILSETHSRQINKQLSELALQRLGARPLHVIVPTPRLEGSIPIRSTGASNAVQQLGPVIRALSSCVAVIDVTVEGMLHSVELAEILAGGTRLYMISDEHPELLERLVPNPALRPKVEAGAAMMRNAREMRVLSDAGTDLVVDMRDAARIGGNWGFSDAPGSVAHWPGGLCAGYPRAGAVNGTVVMDAGDVNLTFKRYIERPVTLRLENDFITSIEGKGTDAELMRAYYAAWNDKNAYASAHLGWGMNPDARWEALTMYDRGDVNGTELRVFAGNFLFSTGANKYADRFTLGHFDLPMRNCTVLLDGKAVVDKGRLAPDLTM